MTNPPAHQVEVENFEATTDATDAIMAEANDATASIPAPAAGPQFDYDVEHRP